MSTESDVNDFETLLPAGPEPVAHLEARLALIGHRRKESRETNEALDRFLVERCAQLTARNASLETQLNDVNTIQAADMLDSTNTSNQIRRKV